MKSLLRPSSFMFVLALAVVGAASFLFQNRSTQTKPQPLPVAAEDQEIVWLYPATNGAAWERFVSALRYTVTRLPSAQGNWRMDTERAFPLQTTAVPEMALLRPGGGRLVFRWYKLTSDWKSRDWIESLLMRNPPPLAVIGGSSSDVAHDLALQLQSLSAALPPAIRPLLLLTTATADRVAPIDSEAPAPLAPLSGDEIEEIPGVPLRRIYPGRTFRYCFTNRQMARAVTRFLWNHRDLFPDADPVHMVQWEDDAYSLDLIAGFRKELRGQITPATAQEWLWLTSNFALGGSPVSLGAGVFPWRRAGELGSGFRMALPPNPQRIDYSVGTFATPNRPESVAAGYLLDDMERRGLVQQSRPLLVVTGQSSPTRHFLRALARTAPDVARRFTVVTGDAIAFNTVYRDREVAWPIQDLPFSLVFFCHHNPIDADAGFQPIPNSREPGSTERTGTEDVLLYADIIGSLAQAIGPPSVSKTTADTIVERLAALRIHGDTVSLDGPGRLLFDHEGNRQSGTGEHVVSLRPQFRGERVLAQAVIEVWSWQLGEKGTTSWHRRGDPLTVFYEQTPHLGE